MLTRLCCLLFAFLACSAHADQPLPAEQAYRFSAAVRDAQTLEARWQIAEGYYMYRDKFRFELENQSGRLLAPQLPPGKLKEDELFGKVETYRHEVVVRLPLASPLRPGENVVLKVTAQGCWDGGICYPPQNYRVELIAPGVASAEDGQKVGAGKTANQPPAASARPAAAGTPPAITPAITPATTPATPQAVAPSLPPRPAASEAADATSTADTADSANESARIAGLLKGGSLGLTLLSFFGFGLLLSLTPCVFPMVPILSGIIVNHGHAVSHTRAFVLSSAYVLGMALTYAIAGVAAGLSGSLLSSALQNAWVLGGFALIFVVLSLSMFDIYELQLPASLQSRLSATANRQGGSLAAIALMGALSALIVGPCVAAPLAGALLYIAQSGDALLGGLALFVLALGMGAPLVLVGTFSRSLLPRPGPWMEGVKRFFGVLMLATALYLVMPVLPAWLVMLGWALLLILPAIHLSALDPLPTHAHGWQRLGKGLGVVLLIAGALMLVGLLAGARNPLQPLAFLHGKENPGGAAAVSPAPSFSRLHSIAELEQRLAAARGKPVLLDFWAEWCISCKELEVTFAEPRVAARLKEFVLLQADVTANSEEEKALLARFGLFGPPGLVFFDRNGEERRDVRVVGTLGPDEFLPILQRAQR